MHLPKATEGRELWKQLLTWHKLEVTSVSRVLIQQGLSWSPAQNSAQKFELSGGFKVSFSKDSARQLQKFSETCSFLPWQIKEKAMCGTDFFAYPNVITWFISHGSWARLASVAFIKNIKSTRPAQERLQCAPELKRSYISRKSKCQPPKKEGLNTEKQKHKGIYKCKNKYTYR